jgi:hypothetical protein
MISDRLCGCPITSGDDTIYHIVMCAKEIVANGIQTYDCSILVTQVWAAIAMCTDVTQCLRHCHSLATLWVQSCHSQNMQGAGIYIHTHAISCRRKNRMEEL